MKRISIDFSILSTILTFSALTADGEAERLRFLKLGSQTVEDFHDIGTEVVCEAANTPNTYLLVRFDRNPSLTPIPEVLRLAEDGNATLQLRANASPYGTLLRYAFGRALKPFSTRDGHYRAGSAGETVMCGAVDRQHHASVPRTDAWAGGHVV